MSEKSEKFRDYINRRVNDRELSEFSEICRQSDNHFSGDIERQEQFGISHQDACKQISDTVAARTVAERFQVQTAMSELATRALLGDNEMCDTMKEIAQTGDVRGIDFLTDKEVANGAQSFISASKSALNAHTSCQFK